MLRAIVLIFVLWPALVLAAPWDIVQEHTRIEVDVVYLGSTVTMRFETVQGSVDFDANRPERAKADIVVPVAQVETGLGLVNGIVRSRDYLNAREFPEIRFQLERLERTSDSTADIYGKMTLLGVTQPILFRAKLFRYSANESSGKFEAGFNLTGQVDRRSYGNMTALSQVSAVLPIRIQLLMRER